MDEKQNKHERRTEKSKLTIKIISCSQKCKVKTPGKLRAQTARLEFDFSAVQQSKPDNQKIFMICMNRLETDKSFVPS